MPIGPTAEPVRSTGSESWKFEPQLARVSGRGQGSAFCSFVGGGALPSHSNLAYFCLHYRLQDKAGQGRRSRDSRHRTGPARARLAAFARVRAHVHLVANGGLSRRRLAAPLRYRRRWPRAALAPAPASPRERSPPGSAGPTTPRSSSSSMMRAARGYPMRSLRWSSDVETRRESRARSSARCTIGSSSSGLPASSFSTCRSASSSRPSCFSGVSSSKRPWVQKPTTAAVSSSETKTPWRRLGFCASVDWKSMSPRPSSFSAPPWSITVREVDLRGDREGDAGGEVGLD